MLSFLRLVTPYRSSKAMALNNGKVAEVFNSLTGLKINIEIGVVTPVSIINISNHRSKYGI